MSLVNDYLKFQMAILQIHCYYFNEKKSENLLHCKEFSHFFNKKYSVFSIVVNILGLNDSVKLTNF